MTTNTFDFAALINGLDVTHKVRMETIDGAPWFVAADVCRMLGLGKDFQRHLTNLAEDQRRFAPLVGSAVRGGGAWLISKSGLFLLILRSRKPVARPFQDCVFREVIPSIRKTGKFTMEPGEVIPLPAGSTDALRQHAAAMMKLAEEQEAHATTQAERNAADAAKAQAVAEMGRLEPLAKAMPLPVLRGPNAR